VKPSSEKKGRLVLIEPKTEKSRRVIMLPKVAVSALAAHRIRQEEERRLRGSRWQESGMVFTTKRGTMLDPRNMLRAFYTIMNTPDPKDPTPDVRLKRKLLPRLRFHDLRDSAATLLLAQGVHPRFIMELFGHSSISLTMNTYGHVLEEMKRETATRMDQALEPVAVNVAVKPSPEKAN
jgi:integrase